VSYCKLPANPWAEFFRILVVETNTVVTHLLDIGGY
jgi:hypothetical protein